MAEKELLRFQKIFKGNFYVELQYHGMEDEAYVMPILAELAYRNGVSVVATNDVHIIRPEDAEGRSYLKSLRFEKFEPVTDSDRELYLKSDTELSQKLCEIIPENIVKSAIANIRVICDKCNVDIPRVPEAQHYPVFLDEMGQRVDAPKLLRQKAYCGLKRKVSTISQKYIDRMEYELNTIIDMGYADYILIVADYVQEGKRIAKMAEALWESLEGFARYAFNRSHAAVYALISYMTAWLKFHYPVEFMCAVLNASELDRISLAVKECSTMGVSVISPDINRSEMQFSDYNGKILYGLAAIKGISSASMQEMIEERKKGKFQNYCDLLARVSIGKADMEKLIVSGALDKCGFSRTALKNAILPAFAIKNKYIKDYTTEEICRKLKEEISLSQSSDKENWLLQLNEEKELLGAYISGHPLEQFKLLKADKSITPLSHAEAEKPQIYMGVISNIKEFRQRNDGIGVTFDLEDWDGLASCIVFAQHYKQVQKYIKDGNVIKVYGYFNKQDEESFSNELIARQIFPCHPYSNHVFISFQSRTEWPDVCQSLKPYLVEQGHPVIFYECDNGSIREHLQFKGKEIFLNDDVLHLKTDAIRNIRKLNF